MQQPMGSAEQTAMNNQQQQQMQQQLQQQLNQQQLGQQQLNQQQQMVLCPVRVVYETQILMPPGEQMQPNQTIFVNPQNQPPWANPSTPMYQQNQVLYVQQMPNNMVAATQPTIDQNQLQYIQQAYPNMQQVVTNPNILTQTLQDRQVLRQPMQYANMNIMGVNQYGQVINMSQMANIAQNIPNIIQSPIGQNIQLMQSPANTQQKQQETQQQSNMNMLRNQMQQTQQTMIRQNVPQQQIISRGIQQNMPGSPMQIQQNHMQQIQAKPNIVQQQNQAQQNTVPQQQNTVQQQQNIQKQMNIQTGVQTHVQTQVNMTHAQPKQIVNAQSNLTGNPIQIMPNLNQQQIIQQRQLSNMPQTNQVVMQASVQQNAMQKQSVPVSISQMQPHQNYVHRPNVQQNVGQFTQQQQPNRGPPPNNLRQPHPMNQNIEQQRQNVGTQQRNNFTQQYPKMMVRQTTPMEYTPSNNPQSNIAATTTNQVRPPQVNAKIGIPLHGIPNRPPQNGSPQIRPKIVPAQNTSPRVPPSHQQVRNIPQLRPTGNHSLIQMQNMMSVNPIQTAPRPLLVTSQVPKQTTENPITMINNIDNRKRKSESPDECRNKVTVNMSNQLVFNKSVDSVKINETKKTVSDAAVNTTTMATKNTKIDSDSVSPLNNIEISKETQSQKTEKMEVDSGYHEIHVKATVDAIQEKLVRNTVFAQAKSRNVSMSSNDGKNIESHDKHVNINEVKTATISDDSKLESMKADHIKKEVIDNPIEAIPVEVKPPKQTDILATKEEVIKKETIIPVKYEAETVNKSDSQTDEEKIKRISDFLGKELELSHGNIKKRDGNENNYILTHVLDGIVIQESNVAFPIRLPLKEKILSNSRIAQNNLDMATKTEAKVEQIETKSNDAKIASTISKLHLEEEKDTNASNEIKKNDDDDVFSSLKSQTIKTWTAEDLATHLSKKGWLETASILQDNEIDGEALFLVSHTQLLDIGINDTHAQLLSNFVKS